MGDKIKLKERKKDIKILDKAAAATEHMKQGYIKTKDEAEKTQVKEDSSPERYAEGQVSQAADKTARGIKKQGKKTAGKIKQKHRDIELAREEQSGSDTADGIFDSGNVEPGTNTEGGECEKQKQQRYRQRQNSGRRQQADRALESQKIRTAGEREAPSRSEPGAGSRKAIKTSRHNNQGTARSSGKAVKKAGRTIKTADNSGRVAIKTSGETAKATRAAAQNSARAAQAAVRTSARTAQRAGEAAKAAAKTAVTAVKAAAKAAVSAVKGIIAATQALIAAIGIGGCVAVLVLIIVILFGSVLSLIGSDSSNTSASVSAEVQAYEPVIRKYANEHGIGEYVELIKAVMMQESGGRGLDPMQASECGYNKKYPNTPGGITDPEYSIDVGIQNLAACLKEAEAEHPVDMERIKLALQGYNFGNGYIAWAKKNHEGYSAANAAEFSAMMAAKTGWSSYGDIQYVPHVLRYYTFGRVSMGEGSTAIVQVALAQEGNKGGKTYWSWYGFSSRQPWCACFVSWCADQCGYIEAGIIPKFSLCTAGAKWFKDNDQWQDSNYIPAPGDIIFFDREGKGITEHVGIVEYVDGGMVYTIEGNSGDKCKRRSYSLDNETIYGYGVPLY